jgi:acetyl esterase/lipase
MLKILVTIFCFLSLLACANDIRLWEGDAPGAKGNKACDIPTLTPHLVKKTNGKKVPAVIICPGGAYSFRAVALEGTSYAKLFNKNGISAFVLAYRVGAKSRGAYRYPIPQLDAKRAIRYVRANAEKFNIDPEKIGIVGSSAGGHLAAMTAVKHDVGNPKAKDYIERVSSRPDFAILCYAQTSMDKRYGECAGSRNMLLGDAAGTIEEVATYKFVNEDTPPMFLWHSFQDMVVPVRNALDLANALEANLVPFSLHIYFAGKHGLGTGGKKTHPWCDEAMLFLKEIEVIK